MSSRSSFLCFICHSNVHAETSEESREKYREIVGINLCPDSQLCYICCHVLNKLSLFRSICLKRSLEFPVPFSEKGTINLQKSDTEVHIVCPEIPCVQYGHCRSYYTYSHDYSPSDNYNDEHNQYVALEDNKFNDYFNTINTQYDDVVRTHNDKAVVDNDDVDEDYVMRIKSRTDDPQVDFNDKIESVATVDEFAEFTEHDNYENCVDEPKYDDDHNNDDNEDYKKPESHAGDPQDLFNDKIEATVNDEFADFTEQNDNYESVNEPEYDDDKYDENEDKNGTDNIFNEITTKDETKEVKVRKKKKKSFKKILLSVEEQKAELEARRKEKKYLEAEFKCYNCALPFLFKDTYQAHMMRHEESNGEYQCEICTLRFASPATQRIHALRPPQRVACHLCGNLLKHAKGLQQHLKRVHMSKTSNRVHSCNVCGESFPSQHTVRTHMIKHIKRRFGCGRCPAVCSSPYTLARHERRHAGGLPPPPPRRHSHLLECPVCMKICPNQRGLTLHMQAIHSNRKDHACPHCDARYSTRPSLLRHIALHTRKPEPKTAVCHVCGSSFKDRSKLNRHLRNVCEKAKLEEQLADLYE